MNAGDFFAGLYHFFNDFVGLVIPGMIFLLGVAAYDLWGFESQVYEIEWAAQHWFLFLVLSYLLGHLFRQLYEVLFARKLWHRLKIFRESKINPTSSAYLLFREKINQRLGGEGKELGPHEVRSLAMTLSAEAGEISRRFMFISLACSGVAVSLFLLVALVFVEKFLNWPSSFWWWASLIAISGSATLLLIRGLKFNKRALNVTFAIAISELIKEKRAQETE